jgi:tetratricopeptide (TPR) repeat protein
VKSVLDLCPHDAWARRQLALVLADRKHDSDALEQIRLAGEAEPDHPSHFAVLGHVHRRAERLDDALETYRDAIRQDADHELAVGELVRLSRGRKDRRANLRFIAEHLHAQPHAGDGLVAYRDQVLTLASEEEENDDLLDELYRELDRALEERPDLWQAWSLMVQQLGLMQRTEEALAVALDATERFPLQAQLWSDLARVYGELDRSDERIDALRQAVAVAPDWGPAAHDLAVALAEAGEEADALGVLERAAARNPHDPSHQAALADRLWAAGYSEDALEKAKLAVRLDPGFDACWRMILHWADRLERPDEIVALARELTTTRPGDARGWLKLSRLLHDPEQNAEALAALETVIRLDPKNIEAYDQKAERLADMGRFEEAIEAASPPELAEELPFVLQGRAAWVEAKRGNYKKAIPPMQRLVTVEPEYFWGWQQLAEWYNETDRKEEYLDATGELVRLKPDHPMPLTMRGEAKLKTNDRAGGKADLRDALRLAPQYAPAAAILFDACLADHEIRDARMALAVLQEHAGGPEVLVKQVQLASRTDDAEAAMRTLADLSATPAEGPPTAMQLALTEIEAAGWEERAAKILHEAFTSDEPFNPWAALFWLDTPMGEEAGFDERLAAVDAVIVAHPTFAAAYDRKTELLAAVGRFDDAAATCRAPGLGDPPPLTLRGRAAWVEAKRGHRAKAITLMKQVVADEPGYLWGWRNLAQWYDAEGRQKECLEAAEQMVRLSPDDPVAYGYRGEARRTLGDRPGAKADFAKAFELDPRFDAAGLHLIAEQLEANEIDAANRTLVRVQEHADGPLFKLRATQVAAKQRNLALARQRLRAVATDSDTPTGLLREAAAALDRQGWTAEVDDDLGAIVKSADATPAASAVWADRLIARNKEVEVLDTLPELFHKNPNAGREATIGYAVAMAAAGHPDKTATTIHRFADHLRTDPEAWAKAGAALAEAKSFALAASWLGDWKQRDGVEAWMLRPLTDSLRAQDRDAEASAVAAAAAALPGPPAVLADFRGWLALEAALAGRVLDAAALLAGVDRVGLPDGVRLVVAVAEALVMVQRAGPDAKPAAFADAKEHLHAAAGACAAADVPPGLCRWYKRAAKQLAAACGGLGPKVWAWWQQTRPWVR